MRELREAVERVLSDFHQASKYKLAKKLADALELEDVKNLAGRIEEILGRNLTDSESFAVDALGLILRDNNMFIDFEFGDEAAKAGY